MEQIYTLNIHLKSQPMVDEHDADVIEINNCIKSENLIEVCKAEPTTIIDVKISHGAELPEGT